MLLTADKVRLLTAESISASNCCIQFSSTGAQEREWLRSRGASFRCWPLCGPSGFTVLQRHPFCCRQDIFFYDFNFLYFFTSTCSKQIYSCIISLSIPFNLWFLFNFELVMTGLWSGWWWGWWSWSSPSTGGRWCGSPPSATPSSPWVAASPTDSAASPPRAYRYLYF